MTVVKNWIHCLSFKQGKFGKWRQFEPGRLFFREKNKNIRQQNFTKHFRKIKRVTKNMKQKRGGSNWNLIN